MAQQSNRSGPAEIQRELEHAISLLSTPELPWRLPVKAVQSQPQKGVAKSLELCDTLGQTVQKIQFSPIVLDGRVRFEIPADSRMPILQFACSSAKFPLLRCEDSLAANVPVSLEQRAWRLRHPPQQFGFPAAGCYSVDFLHKGIFASPRGRGLSRRFTVRNHSTQSHPVSLSCSREWLAIEPAEFHLEARESSDVVVRLLPEHLSVGQNQAVLKIRWQKEKIEVPVLASASRAEARAILVSREVSVPVAGLGEEVKLTLQFELRCKGELQGAVTDPFHRAHIPFRASGETGRLEIPVSLPTGELFRAVHSEWPLYISFDDGTGLSTEKVLARLQRNLRFDPPTAILAARKPAVVFIKGRTKEPILPRVTDIPAGLEVELTHQLLSIRARSTASKASRMEWLAVVDDLSGERADLGVFLQGEGS